MTEDLIEVYIDKYMTQFGQSESVELMERLSKAKLFYENLRIAVNRNEVPRGRTINNIIHGCHYKFVLANKRKIYFCSLFFLKILCENYRDEGLEPDELELSRSLMEVCEIYTS